MHNKPRYRQFQFYGPRNKSKGSIAEAFYKFDMSIRKPPKIKELNEMAYKQFCDVARDPCLRSSIVMWRAFNKF